ncbi:MAG: pentapeptide repeat-containing protein [Pseudomonadota bacterium]
MSDEELQKAIEAEEGPLPRRAAPSGLFSVTFAFLILILGLALGATLSTIGFDVFVRHAEIVFGTLIGFFLFLGLLLLVLFLVRGPILRLLFNRTEVEVDRFAGPIADVARHTAEKRVEEATGAARSFAEMALARYAWVTTRRWMIAAMTGLIASVAALAGSALLFQQNKLLAGQTDLLEGQIDLLQTQVELADSERNRSILPAIIDIGRDIGSELSGKVRDPVTGYSASDLSPGLISRIVTASTAARPYRYLKASTGENPFADVNSLLNAKALARRDDVDPRMFGPLLSDMIERGQVKTEFGLIDDPVSPERGLLFTTLQKSGILNLEALSFAGASFAYAEVTETRVFKTSFNFATTQYADFSNSELRAIQFRGTFGEHMRFRKAILTTCDFSALTAAEVKPPYAPDPSGADFRTSLTGTRFEEALIIQSAFRNVNGFGLIFEKALLASVDFSNSSISASSFDNAILIDVSFKDASLQLVDFDGAIVFEEDFINRVAKEAAQGTFRADRFEMEPFDVAQLNLNGLYNQIGIRVPASLIEGKKAYRIKRVKAFSPDAK